MLRFEKWYFFLAMLIFVVEVFIAVFINDRFVRPYVGDFLVVILIYCFLKSILNVPVITLAIFVLLFSFTIEVLQYYNLVDLLGLGDSKLARVVLGTSFQWIDLVAYTLGIAVVISIERIRSSKI